MSYPAWWQDGKIVVNKDGVRGALWLRSDDTWAVSLTGCDGYIVHPEPSKWQPVPGPILSPAQVRRLVYEADLGLLGAVGRAGGALPWISVPESARCADEAPLPRPLIGDDLSAVRLILRRSIAEALRPFTA